ncbi:MAG: trypsin-like serine protease [Lentilitoribacter sp.]
MLIIRWIWAGLFSATILASSAVGQSADPILMTQGSYAPKFQWKGVGNELIIPNSPPKDLVKPATPFDPKDIFSRPGFTQDYTVYFKELISQHEGLRKTPGFSERGSYFVKNKGDVDYFVGKEKLNFLKGRKGFYSDLLREQFCPYCVFLGEGPSIIEVSNLLSSATLASNEMLVAQQGGQTCPTTSLTASFGLQPLDECLLPVVALTKASADGRRNSVVCSGTIVGPNHILTAAHCACLGVTDVFFGTAVPQYSMGLTWQLPAAANGFAQHHGSDGGLELFAKKKRILSKPIFYAEDKRLCDSFAKDNAIPSKLISYDIALLKLDPNSGGIRGNFSSRTFANLPGLWPLLNEQSSVFIAGFGPDGNKYRSPQVVKRYALTKVLSRSDTQTKVGEKGRRASTCSGDSGSGVYTITNGKLSIHGVLSSGRTDCTGKDPISNFASIAPGTTAHSWLVNELRK